MSLVMAAFMKEKVFDTIKVMAAFFGKRPFLKVLCFEDSLENNCLTGNGI